MPNTLAHYGIQILATRTVLPRLDVKWLLLGPVVPDLPWIGHRLLGLVSGVDPLDLRLYAVVQASLLFCLVLSAAFALMSRHPRLIFAVLAANCLFHLLLDALETKWANGVHLLAPYSWDILTWGFWWPESLTIQMMTLLGLVTAVWVAVRSPGEATPLVLRSARRWAAAIVLLAGYLAAPFALMAEAEQANPHFVRTLRLSDERAGRLIEFDRARLILGPDMPILRAFTGENLQVVGGLPPVGSDPPERTVSARAVFLDPQRIFILDIYTHTNWLREAPTFLGLLLLATVWLRSFAVPANDRPVLKEESTGTRPPSAAMDA